MPCVLEEKLFTFTRTHASSSSNFMRPFTLLLIFCATLVWHHDTPVDSLAKALKNYTDTYVEEKIWLHTDKPYYAPGETIWLSAYLHEANSWAFSPLSRILYVELISPEAVVLKRLTLQVTQGRSKGDLTLSDTLRAGIYRLRAYTNWQRNFGEELFYDRPLTVVGENQTTTLVNQKPALKVHFFPESGLMLNGFRNRIAFKITDWDGQPLNLSGIVVNQYNQLAARLQTVHDGLGSFRLVPQIGETYTARIYFPDSTYQEFPLPDAQSAGMMMNVLHTPADTAYRVQLYASQSYVSSKTGIVLAVQGRGEMVYAVHGKIENTFTNIRIPKRGLPQGILQLTLFTENLEPIAERLVFHRTSESDLQIQVTPSTAVASKRMPVSMEITTTRNGKPVAASLSLAVLDADRLPEWQPFPEDIMSYIMLTSELPGLIRNPSFYLQNNEKAYEALDLLMMTHGWRRFVWKKILQPEGMRYEHPIEQTFSISGQVRDKKGVGVPDAKITVLFQKPVGRTIQLTADEKGRFTLTDLDFFDSLQFSIQASTAKGNRDVQLALMPRSYPAVSPLRYALQPTGAAMAYLENWRKQTQANRAYDGLAERYLQEVVIKDTRMKPEQEITQGSMLVTPDAILTYKDIDFARAAPSGNVLQALQGRVAGVTVGVDQFGNATVQIRGINSITSGTTPLLLIDGMPMSDISAARSISPNDVAAIEVLKGAGAAAYGANGANGVINIITKRGNHSTDANPLPGIFHFKEAAYYKAREFFVPDYTTQPNAAKPDLRTTLFWQPIIQTDSITGKAKVSFYTADNATHYRYVVQGTNGVGNLGISKGHLLEVR
ncbi:MAG: TonB-dependent receptor plug domain-containing protein [Cytophagales bacterium]|nr:TonB-dependent receptor plug domain-containing protein [Bernardetiaceae bacterium]MDW8205444.1 TonB-dependent receptor plug domain-containing protein [Cytophagales bacterium]